MKLLRIVDRAWSRVFVLASHLWPRRKTYWERVESGNMKSIDTIIGWAVRHDLESRIGGVGRTATEVRAAAHQIRTKPLNFTPPKGERHVIGVPKHELTGRDMMQQWDYLKYKALQAGAKTGDEIWVTEDVKKSDEVIVYWYEKP